MIPLEKQIVSFETAKGLKELGVPQESYFTYACIDGKVTEIWTKKDLAYLPAWSILRKQERPEDYLAAFTSTELGEIINKLLPSKYYWYSEPYAGIWYCRLYDTDLPEGSNCLRRIETDNETEGRGLMIQYLIENKLVSV